MTPPPGPASEPITHSVLDDSQLARSRRYGTTRRVTAGETLYSPADDSCDLLVVLSGEVVVSNDALGHRVELARHGPGQFAGELNMLTGVAAPATPATARTCPTRLPWTGCSPPVTSGPGR
jgi:CRP-like cAMP-binding protein